jgi:hypothetical protein
VSSTLTADAPAQAVFTLRATLTETTGGAPIPGRVVVMTTSGGTACQAVTDVNGVVSCNGLGAAAQILFDSGYTATFGGDAQFLASSARPTLLTGASGSSLQVPPTSLGPTTVVPTSSAPRGPGRLPATGGTSSALLWGLVLLTVASAGAALLRSAGRPPG